MKNIQQLFSTMILAVLACTASYGQNAIKHIDNATNVNLDYMPANDEYLLSGNTHPASIAGMSNVGPWAGNLSRIQLEVLDNQLNNVWFKTYCTALEVNNYVDMTCTHLTTYFTTGDAKQTSDGGFIVCGAVRIDGETSGCPGPTYDHLFLLKTDGSGNVQWYKRYYDPNMQFGMLNSVIEASNGNFITCGYENYGSSTSALIIGTNSAGNLIWSNYAQTPAYWDHNITIPSIYYEITPYNNYYALVGISNTFGGVWGGTLLTVIDNNGNYIADNIIDNQKWGYVLTGHGLHDAYDNDVIITGAAGTPCQTGAQVMLLKIDPVTLAQNFFKVYSFNNLNDASWGNSVVTWGAAGGNFSLTGRDYTNAGGLYLETDNNGNLLRYTPFNDPDASDGKSIVWNSTSSFPAYSGVFNPGVDPTFIVRNNYGTDCPDDIFMPEYDTPTETYPSHHIVAPIIEVDEDLLAFDIDPIENIVCGQLKPATTSINNVLSEHGMQVVPNPANGYIDVTLNTNATTLQVYDLIGRTVITQNANNKHNTTRIDISTLAPGTYILYAVDAKGQKSRTTFIKE